MFRRQRVAYVPRSLVGVGRCGELTKVVCSQLNVKDCVEKANKCEVAIEQRERTARKGRGYPQMTSLIHRNQAVIHNLTLKR